ncbi:hypothetical protein ABTX81_30785 [Kitasatospora sp. NPDC097605]|uniref:hypothetical protein n=1 Tax=Kitasatospora sp. NPDC097605 TaxID=3157226 RepID=UPI00332B571B
MADTPPSLIVHEATVGAAAHVLAARGGTAGLAENVRDRLRFLPCTPNHETIEVTTTTADNGAVQATARVECADRSCVFKQEVQVQREVLTTMLDETREIVTEAAEHALLHTYGGDREAAWAEYRQTLQRALGGLRDALEPYTAELAAAPARSPSVRHSFELRPKTGVLRLEYSGFDELGQALDQGLKAAASLCGLQACCTDSVGPIVETSLSEDATLSHHVGYASISVSCTDPRCIAQADQ